MAHKGLNPDAVVKAAAELIEKQGREAFSMRLLAEDLGIKTASLYNHVDNMETLLAEVCRYGLCLQKEVEMYGLIMSMSAKNQQVRDDAAVLFTDPLKKMLEEFHLKEEENIHFRRLFRAIVHGFVSQEEQGFFSHYPASVEDSFHFAVQCYIDSLKQGEKRCS